MSSAVETSALCVMSILQAVAKVAPVWVTLSNQSQLLISPPAFDLLFSCNRRKDVAERFNINQRVNLIAMGKTFYQSGLVLTDSFADIVGESDIQSTRLVTSHFITSNLVMSFREIAVFAVTNEFLDSRLRGNDSYEMACSLITHKKAHRLPIRNPNYESEGQ